MSLPTITGVPPETWEQVLQILNQMGLTIKDLSEMGITTWEGAGGLKEYLINNGWELKEVWDLKYMWFNTGAADPTQTNAIVQYVANKVAVAGAAGSQYVQHFTYGGSTMGKLKKGVVFGVIFALLVSSLNPTLITDALKGRLGAVIDRFADENGDVPVIVGEDGKTYYHEEMINALRQGLIDEGVYSTGEAQPAPTPTVLPSYSFDNGVTWNEWSEDVKTQYNILRPYIKISNDRYWYSSEQLNGNIAYYQFGDMRVNKVGFVKAYGGNLLSSYMIVSDDTPLGTFQGTLYLDSGGTASSGSYTIRKMLYRKNGIIKSVTYVDNNISSSGRVTIEGNGYTYGDYANTSSASTVLQMYAYTFGEGGGSGVDGITVASDLIDRGVGNIATALEDVFPSYATDKITTINPTDEDITASDNWYPISSSDNDVWTDGITEQQSESATDGEVTPDVQSQIADAIKQILEDYYRDPTDPSIINYPEIEAGDNGDTPPAEPPLISGSANGLWSIYNPTLQQVQDFGAYLWSESILDQITRMFNSPIDAVIGFHMIYCTPIKGPAKNIKCGYLDTGVSSITVANQYATIDCGTIEVPEYYRTALDYVATKLALYLPFIGIVPLSTAVCIGSTLQVIYRIDVLTGTCLAQVKVIKENSDAVMYAFEGNCSVQIPLTATTYTGIASALINTVSAGLSVFMGDYISAAGDVGSALGAGMTNLSGTKQSGQMGANAGALGIRIPYLIITHPVSYDALQYNTQYGYPLNQTISLGSVTGYTRVKDIHLAGIPCTDDELEMIERLLKNGVIIN